MKDFSGGRVSVLVLFGTLIAATSSALGALRLFVEVSAGAGSHEGNILRLGFGLLLILTSLLIFGTAAIYFKSRETSPGPAGDSRSGARF